MPHVLIGRAGGAAFTPETLDRLYRFRHRVFRQRLCWDVSSIRGRERDCYDEAAQLTADHYEQVLDKLGEHDPDAVPALHEQLRDADDAAARLGGLLGHTLVAGKLVEQLTGFFVGEADPQTASLFRGYGGDLDELREDVLELVDDLDVDDDAVVAAATDAVQAAYESYTEQLEAMGVNPKPVC